MKTKVLNYRVIIEPEKYEDGSLVYSASCPTLGVHDYGDTVEGVLASIKDGIELAVESLVKEGKEVPVDDVEKQIIATTGINVPSSWGISVT